MNAQQWVRRHALPWPPDLLLSSGPSDRYKLRGLISSSKSNLAQHLSNPRKDKFATFAAWHMTSLREKLEGASRANPSTACDNPPALLPSLQNW